MCAYTDLPVAVFAGDLREQVGYGEAGAGTPYAKSEGQPSAYLSTSGHVES